VSQTVDRLHHTHCRVCSPTLQTAADDDVTARHFAATLTATVASQLPIQPASTHALRPQLTAGQRRLLDAEWDRLRRLLDVRIGADLGDPARILGAVVLLDDMARQAPALDAAIQEEDARRFRVPNLTVAVWTQRPAL
jgi:hypothetical protein